ncbi:hypothetical protein DSCO28_35170 [Desulfosarcina ovata subsp. sediminis]|uniref:POTRA domain-containing protein n=1 Tax=Desulfosarcina ovata subsp. sediminis TaxID=885957 RepID=A0A5K7ZRW8_9BACT|nr:FtsQ-type POTRA domain-containing protein [Desulfosarcina ovata]BBO82951.1 hypothetical protein DSCO28_35170 [Desulfosarcina ovata subsp. sediminis]
MKPTRKNRFRKDKTRHRATLRRRIRSASLASLVGLALVATSAAFILAYDYFTQSRHFRVRQIEVDGQRRLDRQHILAVAGIGPETNILALNLTVARKRLLADPWIAEAAISRDIPSGLHVSVREEDPLALMEMPDKEGFLINTAGRIFKRETHSDTGPWPQVQGLDHRDLPVPGRPVTHAFQAVMDLLTLAREKNSPLPLAQIRRIHLDRQIGATVFVGDAGQAIKLGFGHFREKCAALGALHRQMHADSRLANCQTIDLFDINRIVITMAPAASSDSASEEVKVAGT